MVGFPTKIPNLDKFRRVLQWKMMVYFMDAWSVLRSFCYILWTFGIIRGNLVYFFPFWYFVPRKSGNPDDDQSKSSKRSSDLFLAKSSNYELHTHTHTQANKVSFLCMNGLPTFVRLRRLIVLVCVDWTRRMLSLQGDQIGPGLPGGIFS
jgi:hypothetical protein